MAYKSMLMESLQRSPIIAAVKDDEGLEKALASDCEVIFYLYGTLLSISELVARATAHGKTPIVHLDLIEGLSTKREVAVDFIRESTQAAGVISTRPALLRRAKACGLLTIQRFFLLDSLAFNNVVRQRAEADFIEFLPGAMPKILSRLSGVVSQPMIASGLITDKEDIIAALSSGAVAVSCTNPALWFL